jgi:hypothetical protein
MRCFAPELLGGFHFPEFAAGKLNNLIPQNWSLIRWPESSFALQFGKVRISMSHPASNGLMSEHALFEYRALLVSSTHVEEKGEPVHCLIKIETAAQDGRIRRGAELEQEAGDLVLFLINPGPHRRISHSSICKAEERRLHELGPANDFNRVGNSEVYFYAS